MYRRGAVWSGEEFVFGGIQGHTVIRGLFFPIREEIVEAATWSRKLAGHVWRLFRTMRWWGYPGPIACYRGPRK